MHIQEICDIRAKGSRLYAFINAIRHSDIACGGQYCKGDYFYCHILCRDLTALQKLAECFQIVVEVQHRPSLIGKLRRYQLRLGIPLGVLLCGIFIFYFSNTVATIEIQGNETVSGGLILSILEEEGVSEGTWIAGIDYTHCERRIRAAVPGVAWVGIRHTGSRLVVEISESTPKPEMENRRTPCNIVAQYDAQITDVRVYSGHLTKLIGDGVAAGDMIVSGVFEDEKGHITYHHAMAEITGIYTKEAELTEYFTITKTEQTGKVLQKDYLQLFSWKIPLQLGHKGFDSCTEDEVYIPFSFLDHTLPFGIVQHTMTETTEETMIRSEEDTMLALNGAIVRYEKNFLSDVTILARETEYTVSDTGITCRLTYTVEGEIGKVSDIFVK